MKLTKQIINIVSYLNNYNALQYSTDKYGIIQAVCYLHPYVILYLDLLCHIPIKEIICLYFRVDYGMKVVSICSSCIDHRDIILIIHLVISFEV